MLHVRRHDSIRLWPAPNPANEDWEKPRMPLFAIVQKNSVEPVEQTNFDVERDLQRLVESNLGPLFQCRLVPTEFPTGIQADESTLSLPSKTTIASSSSTRRSPRPSWSCRACITSRGSTTTK